MRTERVNVRLSPAEFDLIRIGAAANGMTEATFMRATGLTYVQKMREARQAAMPLPSSPENGSEPQATADGPANGSPETIQE